MISSGIESVHVKQIEALLKKRDFIRHFTPSEIEYCRRYKDMNIHFASCLAAKLAFLKATSHFVKLDLNDIEIKHTHSGKPFVKIPRNHHDFTISLSISHTKTIAVALCVITDGKHFSARKGKRYS